MPFTLGAYSQSIDTGANLTALDAVTDQHLTTDGDDILVPEFASRLAAVYALGVDLTQVRITAPSLRKTLLLDVEPIDVSATPEPTDPRLHMSLFGRPINLDPSEGLRAEVINDGAGASRAVVGVWLLGSGDAAPEGRIDSVRLTGVTTLVANTWTLCPLTLSQQLEAGTYAIVGMRARSAGAILARLVIPGSAYRPGVIAGDAATDPDNMPFRRAGLGLVWGTFQHTFPPQVEFLSASADTAETVWLDVIRVNGPGS